jgi:hypothetical protein
LRQFYRFFHQAIPIAAAAASKFSVKDQKRQVMVGGGEKISPTMFGGNVAIPD